MDREQTIAALQLVLKEASLYDGDVDSIWGPKCQHALDALVAPSGMDREQTIAALQLVLKEASLYDGDVDSIWGPKCQHALDALVRLKQKQGKGSWYSQHNGKYKWVDTGDGRWNKAKTVYLGPNNALGVPDDKQGFALPERSTLGQWFNVTAPNGITRKLQQTDVGPAKWTRRSLDIAAKAAEDFGYSPRTFPNDGIFWWTPA